MQCLFPVIHAWVSKVSSVCYTFKRNQSLREEQCLKEAEPVLEPTGTGSRVFSLSVLLSFPFFMPPCFPCPL